MLEWRMLVPRLVYLSGHGPEHLNELFDAARRVDLRTAHLARLLDEVIAVVVVLVVGRTRIVAEGEVVACKVGECARGRLGRAHDLSE